MYWLIHRGDFDETKNRGDIVIQALEQFKATNGIYPATLGELTPSYLKEIPLPKWGLQQWIYERKTTGDFNLQVNESIHTGDGNARYLRYYKKEGWGTGD